MSGSRESLGSEPKDTREVVEAELIGVMVPFAKIAYKWVFSVQTGASSLLIRLRDRGGHEGWGEIPMLFHPSIPGSAIQIMAESLLERLVVRRIPNPRAFVAESFAFAGWHFYPHLGALIISGIESALWDLSGRQTGCHISDMLGGRVRDAMECMWFVFDAEPAEMALATKEGAARGFRSFYVKWSSEEGPALTRIEAVVDNLPSNGVLRVDPNESWTRASAIRYMKLLARWPIEFIEQPLPRFDLRGMADLRRRGNIAIACDQSSRTPDEALDAIRLEACDVISVAPSDAGGITRALEIAATARAAGIPVFLHSNVELGVAQASSLVVGCLAENCSYASQTEYLHLEWDIVRGLEFDGPYLKLPSGPGLGVEVDTKSLERGRANYARGDGNLSVLESDLPRRFIPAY